LLWFQTLRPTVYKLTSLPYIIVYEAVVHLMIDPLRLEVNHTARRCDSKARGNYNFDVDVVRLQSAWFATELHRQPPAGRNANALIRVNAFPGVIGHAQNQMAEGPRRRNIASARTRTCTRTVQLPRGRHLV